MSFNVWEETDGCGAIPMDILTNMEKLTITVANVIPPLSVTPFFTADSGLMMLVVNGVTFTPDEGAFSVGGNTLTWNSTIYGVNPGDTVVAIYNYKGVLP